jgi:Asp-tRNA(Asn)/Glu-tRNA(Gln) amidotransferase A subunit family amidase
VWSVIPYKALYTLRYLRKPLTWLAKLIGFSTELEGASRVEELSAISYLWEYFAMEKYARDFSDRWAEFGLDALICPVFGTPAPRHKETELMACLNSHNMLFNYLTYPSGVVPVRVVKESE